jgi:adenosylmethionine-8-amino-7-oxononanoate aminotransferase
VLHDALVPLSAHKNVGEIRQAGLMCGIEIVADRNTTVSFPPGDRIGYHICLSLRDRGIFLRPLGDVIPLMPPLSSTDTELQHLAGSVRAAIVERLGA